MIEKKSLQTEDTGRRRDAYKQQGYFRKRRNPDVLLAFLLTGLLLTCLFMIIGLYPFGSHTILNSDLNAQYAPDLAAYKTQLASGGNLSYSFLIGMGKNTMGLFAYYLASPLNFITFLFPTSMISESTLLLITIKLCLAASFLTLYLRRRFRAESHFAVVFGILYAFSSYSMVYLINIMWLDGFLLLPLLLIFIEQYLENNRYWRRIVLVLLVLFVSGFYIAYMVGIFSFLYLLARLYEENRFRAEDIKSTRKTISLFVGSAVLSIGMSAAVLLPAGLDIMGNPDQTLRTDTLSSNFKFISFLNQLLTGSFDDLSKNKPLVYCGLAVLFLCILYFLNPDFSGRQKRVAGGAFIFFILSFNLSVLDLAWQLFNAPNWFLYRYSFLLVFAALTVGFASLLHLKSLKPKAFAVTGILFLLLLFLVQSFGDLADDGGRFYVNLFIGGIELLCLYAMSGAPFPKSIAGLQKYVPALLAAAVCIETVLVNPMYIRPKLFGGEMEREPIASAITEADDLAAAAKEDAESDGTAFYRMEAEGDIFDGLHPINTGLYLHYSSVSTFNTSSNKELNRFLKQLGYEVNYNYFDASHAYASVVTDSLLGIRYELTEREDCGGYELLRTSENGLLYLQKNKQALPLMYLADADAGSFDFYSQETDTENKNPFVFQDELLVSLFGTSAFSDPVYYSADVSEPVLYNAIVKEAAPAPAADSTGTAVPAETVSDSSSAVDKDLLGEEPADSEDDYGTTYLRQSSKDVLSLTYTVNITSKDPLLMSLPAVRTNDNADVYVNGSKMISLDGSFYTQILSLGSFTPGETVSVSVRSDRDTYSILPALFYYCNTELFSSELAAAVQDQGGQVTVTKAENGFVTADVTAKEEQLLITTIPYEKGWTLLVDGKKTDIIPYQDALISIPVTAGSHTISLAFSAPGLTAGAAVSVVSCLVFAGALFFMYKKRGKKS